MIKEKWYRKWLDYAWITILMAGLVFGSVMIPSRCSAWDSIPDRKAFWQSPALAHEIDIRMSVLREWRNERPYLHYLVQAWADMDTGVFVFTLTIANRIEMNDHVDWDFRIATKEGLMPAYDWRKATGYECIFSYYLVQYEWFHGRNGDI